jgi:hypothetical protein
MRPWTSALVAPLLLVALTPAQPMFRGMVGVNLGDAPMVDMVKQTASYTTTGGAALSGAQVDAQGWPAVDFNLLLLDSRPATEWSGTIDDPDQYRIDYSGVYSGSFTGQASVSVAYVHGTISNVQYSAGTNTTTFNLTLPAPTTGYCFTLLQFSNTKRTAASATNTGITNLKIIRPGYAPATTQVFTNDLLGALAAAHFSVIRAMGLTGTAMMPVVYPARTSWSTRKQLTDASYQPWAGKLDAAPWEVFVDLCNQAQMDMWANIPFSADSAYIAGLAQLIAGRLNSSRNVYIEIDNEVWGYDSPKNYNIAEAAARSIPAQANLARRLVDAAHIFEAAFGPGSLPTRVRPVLAWWAIMPGDVRNMLNYINTTYGSVASHVWAIAPATYFIVSDTLNNSATATQFKLVEGLFASIAADRANRAAWVAQANRVSLPGGLACYEGGPHTPSANTPNAPNLATKIRMHRTEDMAALIVQSVVEDYLFQGAKLYMHFTLSSGYNRYGCWGLTDNLALPDRSPKFKGIRELVGAVTTPFIPTRFTATIASPTQVNLTWVDSATNESGFIISAVDTNGNAVGSPDTVGPNVTSFTDNVASPGNLIYRLRAYNAQGTSTYRRAVPQAATRAAPGAPAQGASLRSAAPRVVAVYTLAGRRTRLPAGLDASHLSALLPQGTYLARISLAGVEHSVRIVGVAR